MPVRGSQTRDVDNFLIGFSIDSEPNKTRVIIGLGTSRQRIKGIGTGYERFV